MKRETLSAALDGIEEKYIQEAAAGTRPARRRSLGRLAAVALAAALCLALAVTAMAAADMGPAYDILYAVSPKAAQAFRPVRLACEDSGVTMEVMAVQTEGDTARIYVAMRDETGDRLDETTDLFDSYALNVPFDSVNTCELVGYDADTNTAVFYIEIRTMNGEPIGEDKVTFRAGAFISRKQVFEGALEGVAVDADENAPSAAVEELSLRGRSLGPDTEPVLRCLPPGASGSVLPVPSVQLTGAGYVDGKLQIQLYFEDIRHTDAHGWVWFTDGEGRAIESEQAVSFWDDQGTGSYEDLVFDIAPETLPGLTLRGDLSAAGCYTEGDWSVTFPLADTE